MWTKEFVGIGGLGGFDGGVATKVNIKEEQHGQNCRNG
jgi:hypothetical protein